MRVNSGCLSFQVLVIWFTSNECFLFHPFVKFKLHFAIYSSMSGYLGPFHFLDTWRTSNSAVQYSVLCIQPRSSARSIASFHSDFTLTFRHKNIIFKNTRPLYLLPIIHSMSDWLLVTFYNWKSIFIVHHFKDYTNLIMV